jgi:hypothetical protein
MGLPAALRSRLRAAHTEKADSPSSSSSSAQEQPAQLAEADNASIKRATRLRRWFALSASFAYLLSWIFLLLVSRPVPKP